MSSNQSGLSPSLPQGAYSLERLNLRSAGLRDTEHMESSCEDRSEDLAENGRSQGQSAVTERESRSPPSPAAKNTCSLVYSPLAVDCRTVLGKL